MWWLLRCFGSENRNSGSDLGVLLGLRGVGRRGKCCHHTLQGLSGPRPRRQKGREVSKVWAGQETGLNSRRGGCPRDGPGPEGKGGCVPGGASLTCARWSPTDDDDGNGVACGPCEGFSSLSLLGMPTLWALGGVGAMWTGAAVQRCSGAGTAGGWRLPRRTPRGVTRQRGQKTCYWDSPC